MPRQKVRLERNTFIAGLITEASPLTFPENASLDERNFVLNRDGSRQRRLGVDVESGGVYTDTGHDPLTFNSFNINTFKWEYVGNSPTLTLAVVQVGYTLFFYNLQNDTVSSSPAGVLILDTASIGYNISGNTLMDFTAIDGKLIIASKELRRPIKVEYTNSSTITATEINIKVRDIWGVDDGLEVDEKPNSLSDEHRYNLFNQGWTSNSRINSIGFPSNAGIEYVGKYIDPNNGRDTWSSSQYNQTAFGTTPAPKGHFIIDAFTRGVSRQFAFNTQTASTVSLPQDEETGRISALTSYASRVWYSGVDSNVVGGDADSSAYAGTLFFTQVITSDRQLERCYQDADPTNEDDPELVATDGGTIKIPEAGSILRLVAKDSSLVVFADNGVWQITGPDNVFRADDFSITKVSNVGCSSKGSVVVVESDIMYWGDGGIYLLTADQVSGRLAAQNLTEATIQRLYIDIPSVGRANTVGQYDPSSRKVSWLFNDTDGYDGVVLRKRYNKELVFDTTVKAFYINEFYDKDIDSPFIAGYIQTDDFVSVDNEQPVVVNGEQVQVNGEDVIVTETVRSRGVSLTKYLTFTPNEFGSNYGLTFSLFNNTSFRDWDEQDAAAYLLTGYEIYQDSSVRKQVEYLTTHLIRTETGFVDVGDGVLEAINPSSCLIQAQWEFANSAASGKWGRKFQAYRLKRAYFPSGPEDEFDYGHKVITTKNRLRGSGRALSLLIESEPEKDLYLLGWAFDASGETNV